MADMVNINSSLVSHFSNPLGKWEFSFDNFEFRCGTSKICDFFIIKRNLLRKLALFRAKYEANLCPFQTKAKAKPNYSDCNSGAAAVAYWSSSTLDTPGRMGAWVP
jgi:hypothetical protein